MLCIAIAFVCCGWSDGRKLIQLMEIVGDASLPKPEKGNMKVWSWMDFLIHLGPKCYPANLTLVLFLLLVRTSFLYFFMTCRCTKSRTCPRPSASSRRRVSTWSQSALTVCLLSSQRLCISFCHGVMCWKRTRLLLYDLCMNPSHPLCLNRNCRW